MKKKSNKDRYCKFCGSLIDKNTKKCTGCGKQFFKGFNLKVILSGMLIASTLISIVTLSVLLKEEKGYSKYWENKYRAEKGSATHWKNKYDEIYEPYSFYNSHVAIVSDFDSGLFHRYGCADCDTSDTSYFWIYGRSDAESRGLAACPKCAKMGFNLAE